MILYYRNQIYLMHCGISSKHPSLSITKIRKKYNDEVYDISKLCILKSRQYTCLQISCPLLSIPSKCINYWCLAIGFALLFTKVRTLCSLELKTTQKGNLQRMLWALSWLCKRPFKYGKEEIVLKAWWFFFTSSYENLIFAS